MKKLELLAPAKNLECGIIAIQHGADAVYIGAQKFGARADAGNSVDDIKLLCDYAHQFAAKVYVTVNTIIYDNELEEVEKLIIQLKEANVDAVLIQDMGLVPFIKASHLSFHASTQTDNRTISKVAWLYSIGFKRVVLARELSFNEIKAIHEAVPDVELEVFVHGALCVSFSGVCYASQYCFGRSANRGECAQFCRLKFDLVDSDNKEIVHQSHLLSMKDLCLINHLEECIDAGACSFKIEGRLKDPDYVKNVVSAYNKQLNEIIRRRPTEFSRASLGQVKYNFVPDLNKTFNRGFTTYFFNGRQHDMASFDTPKVIGEYVGKVKEIRRGCFTIAGTTSFSNGDGLCFFNDMHQLEGFRVNRVDDNCLFPLKMPSNLRKGTSLYRNSDEAFKTMLSHSTADRKIGVNMEFNICESGFVLNVSGKGLVQSKATIDFEHRLSLKPQNENIVRQLTKLGATPFECLNVDIKNGSEKYFIPSSILVLLRRKAIEKLYIKTNNGSPENFATVVDKASPWQKEYSNYKYMFNVSNFLSFDFYKENGIIPGKAFEISKQKYTQESLIMQCRYCIRYSLGFCVKYGGKRTTWHEPVFIQLFDGQRFRLQFDCSQCVMKVYGTNEKIKR
jgi:23S rRNA 5-hydroxycytidine C2501 synthase